MEEKVYKMALIRYLTSLTKKENIPKIIEYYREIGWISQELAEELKKYVKGVLETGKVRENWELTPEEHLKALLYIALIQKGKEAMEELSYPLSLSNWIFESKKQISLV